MLLVTLSHFLVDLNCAFLVANLEDSNILVALIIYNFCAFALQMPLGIIIDGKFPPLKTASLGIFLTVIAWLFTNYSILSLFIAGVGNALFHLGGGLAVMNRTTKASPLGVFIAPGALGIFMGALLNNNWKIPILLILSIFTFFLWVKKESTLPTLKMSITIKYRHLVIISLFFVVVMRGFIGTLQTFPWKTQWSLIFVIAVVAGKMIGGFLSDKFGAQLTGCISILIASICFFVSDNPILGITGVLFFQMTMPITLWAITQILSKGFGFGLLTFGLFIGSIPTFLGTQLPFSLSFMTIVSLIIYFIAMKHYKYKQGDLR